MGGLHTNRGAKRAREARAALGRPTGRLDCLLTAVEEGFGLPVVVARLAEGVAGACWRDGEATVLWVNGAQPLNRQRFTLAHELGHARCRHDGGLAVDSVQTVSGTTTNPHELEANAFAAELLVPTADLQRLAPEPSLDDVVVVAAAYGVSAIVVAFRCATAGRVSAARLERLRAEIDAGEHLDAFERLGLPQLEDGLAAVDDLPYLSDALARSGLAALLAGDAALPAVADAAGVAPEDLAPAVELIAAPVA